MNLDIGIIPVIILILLAFGGGFLVGGKWKARLLSRVMDLEHTTKAKVAALRKHL